MPTFCHGCVRIPKPGFVLYADVMPDKTLDWTAFQVAILGGAGDFFSDSLDPMHSSDDDELEDITTWFDDFGFKSEGRLVRARRSVPPGRLAPTLQSPQTQTQTSEVCLWVPAYMIMETEQQISGLRHRRGTKTTVHTWRSQQDAHSGLQS
ncbi:hypothetical protein BJF96_g9748 [Verticillium dahliae]|uniref:Uncharacterized protein n=1 Tax=Verticillium dahliae TaxID=27337 RepID=A0AA44W908_VERDA|nr:hypothetical protein BJF96_g9748 [Verticillium dahliae]PNH42252.1 hypothetical protein VD0003_g9830 [Verticillium dahliae]